MGSVTRREMERWDRRRCPKVWGAGWSERSRGGSTGNGGYYVHLRLGAGPVVYGAVWVGGPVGLWPLSRAGNGQVRGKTTQKVHRPGEGAPQL